MDNFESGNGGNGIKKAAKVILYILLIVIVFIGGGATYRYLIEGQLGNSMQSGDFSPAAVEVTPSPVTYTPVPTLNIPTPAATLKPQNTSSPPPKATSTPKPKTPREKVLDQMHKMINSKVEADFIWGEMPITQEGVEKLITEVTASNFPDRDKLLTMLETWKQGDFSNAVNDHNYIWEQLGGTIGKATALRAQ